MEAFLRGVLPRWLPPGCSFEVHPFQGKSDLLVNLEPRLRAYAQWLPADWRLFVVVDRDADDCRALKQRLDTMAQRAGLRTRSQPGARTRQLVNRIAIEELEAWYFGDWDAVMAAYPRASPHLPQRQGFKNPDAIAGGTWEAFERVMQQRGYFKAGLTKIDAARRLAATMQPDRNSSHSFQVFHAALMEAMT